MQCRISQRSKWASGVDSCRDHSQRDRDTGTHLPLDSQSAQNLFSSSASKELRTAWYLSTSFTDLPVIVAMVLGRLQSPRGPCRLQSHSLGFDQVNAVCAEPLRSGPLPPRCWSGASLFHNDGMTALQPTRERVIQDANTPTNTLIKTQCGGKHHVVLNHIKT